jgi:hypothetical protein
MLMGFGAEFVRPPLYLVTVIVVWCAAAVVLLIFSFRLDRKRQVVINTDWVHKSGRCTTCLGIDVIGERDVALRIARQAVESVTRGSSEMIGNTIVGWTREWAIVDKLIGLCWWPQQVAIAVGEDTDAQVHLICCSRPRISLIVSDQGGNKRIALRLANEVVSISRRNDL